MRIRRREVCSRAVAAASAALLTVGLVPGALAAGAQAAQAPVGQGFTVTPSDLAFILKQIKIAEHHAATLTPANPCGTLVGPGPDQIPNRLAAYGLRTVDGSCNNLFPGRETFAAADQTFPRLTTARFRDGEPSPPGFPDQPTSTYAQKRGFVYDSQPRVISNLIVDQTSANPAAVQAAGFPVRAQPDTPRAVPCTTDPLPDGTGGVPANCVPLHTTLPIPNITTDVGLSAPYNAVFTFFGQFFDHGIDQTVKGGSGTVFIPLKADDPLITVGPDGKPGTGDEVPLDQAFMVLTRAQNQPGSDGILGTDDDDQNADNTDSPWVDQSQTYTSHPSHQVFLREYVLNADDHPVSTGKLLGGLPANETYAGSPDGTTGISTWAAVKRQAAEKLGLRLTDADVTSVPLLASDPYGRFIPGQHGLPQYVTTGHGMIEGNLSSPVPVPKDVVRFNTPFVTDIAHNADPSPADLDNNPATPPEAPAPDDDLVPSADFANQPAGTYDNEMLDAHFACGDGRCNENIALTAMHQVFHSEHDRLVGDIQNVLTHDTSPSGIAALADWQLPAADNPSGWNGERLFQAARFIGEMEYQHLVFEEFARKVQPAIEPFEVYNPDVNPAIRAEFAHAVYRFGHSMLTDEVARRTIGPDTAKVTDDSLPLLTAFLNPPQYFMGGDSGTLTPAQAAGSIILGSSDQVGNELDEFATETLRNNLLGLPLDLPAINITRAREAGIPPLNEVRNQLSDLTNDPALAPYESWSDFGQHLKHPESLINFVAAYGKHPEIISATTASAKRAAARAIVDPQPGDTPPSDAADFMLGTGAWDVSGGGTITGLENVDLWVGGLAEATNLNGGLLGSTFNAVFEQQLTDLQNGDRLYYLNRTPGMNLLSQLEGNSFAELIERNTEGTHSLRADAFATADCRFELGNLTFPADSGSLITGDGSVNDDPATADCNENRLLLRTPDGTIQYRSANSVDPPGINAQSVYDGTSAPDRVSGGNDNDTFWGGAARDLIEGSGGDDVSLGGEGNDVLTDLDGADILKGGPGNDALDAGPGLDILIGGDGSDVSNGGLSDNQTFGGPGTDFIVAGLGTDIAQGDGGDDWIQGGTGSDTLVGDHGAPFFDDPGQVAPGNDVFVGQAGSNAYDAEGGDDVMTAHTQVDAFGGNGGYDWAIHQYDTQGADDDMNVNNVLVGGGVETTRDSWRETEAVSGSSHDDIISGDDSVPREAGGTGISGCDALDQAGVHRIAGLADLLPQTFPGQATDVSARSLAGACPLSGPVWGEGNILLGGAGSDTLQGRGGDDIIDGDRAMSVHISVRSPLDHATELGSTDLIESQYLRDADGQLVGPTLQAAVFAGIVDPGDLVISRKIDPPANGGTDTAVFEDRIENYDCTPAGRPTAPCGTTSAGSLIPSDGSVTTVEHARGSGLDGTDIIRNMERLQFSNGIAPPAPIIGSAAAGDRSATVTWTWSSSLGDTITGFSVQVLADGKPVGTMRLAGPNARGLGITGLTNGTTYQFRVRALKNALSSDLSGFSNAVTPVGAPTPPPTPTATPTPTDTSAPPSTPAPVGRDAALISALSRAQVAHHGVVMLHGSVAPFRGVDVTLQRSGTDGTFEAIDSTSIPLSATNGRFSFRLPTSRLGWSSYRVVVTGPDIAPTAGATLRLGVVRARITAVSPSGREFVSVRNTGPIPVQLAGWRLRDTSRKSLALPRFTVAPGATVRIATGSGRSRQGWLYLGRRTDMWGPRHDTARLLDRSGTLVARLRY